MSREAEYKLLAYATQRLGRAMVMEQLAVSEAQLNRLLDGRDWMSREQALAVSELVIGLAAGSLQS